MIENRIMKIEANDIIRLNYYKFQISSTSRNKNDLMYNVSVTQIFGSLKIFWDYFRAIYNVLKTRENKLLRKFDEERYLNQRLDFEVKTVWYTRFVRLKSLKFSKVKVRRNTKNEIKQYSKDENLLQSKEINQSIKSKFWWKFLFQVSLN